MDNEYDANFANAEDFVDCFNRGCELEFLYNGKHYFVTPFATETQDKMSVMDVDDENSQKIYDTPLDALSCPIGDKKLGDILQDMKVIDRTL
jgi:hypothetical protein